MKGGQVFTTMTKKKEKKKELVNRVEQNSNMQVYWKFHLRRKNLPTDQGAHAGSCPDSPGSQVTAAQLSSGLTIYTGMWPLASKATLDETRQ